MKSLILLLALSSIAAFASPQRDALLGTYVGPACHLKIVPAPQGETDIIFTDSMNERTLWGVGQSLEAQLARGATVLVFTHDRQSLGDMTIHLEIRLNSRGLPALMSGTADGWGHTNVSCIFPGTY